MLLVTNNPLTAAVATLFRATRLDVPELAYCNDRIAQSFLPRLPTLREGYRPPALSLGVYQSGLASVNDPPESATQFERETITLPALDRSPNKCCPASVPPGIVSIDWLNQPSADADNLPFDTRPHRLVRHCIHTTRGGRAARCRRSRWLL